MENKEIFTKVGDCYEHDKQGNLYYIETREDKNGESYIKRDRLANHTPIVNGLIVKNDGKDEAEEIHISALRNGKREKTVIVTKSDVLGSNPETKFSAGCRIERIRGSKAKYAESILMQCENLEYKTVYTHMGFIVIDGEHVFLNGKNSVTKDGLTDKYTVMLGEDHLENYRFIHDDGNNDCYKSLLTDLKDALPQKVYYVMLAYTFLTPLVEMLYDKGIPPRFIVYLCGKHRSGKTSIANLFLNFFGSYTEMTTPPSSYSGESKATIEKKMFLLNSTLLLVDERHAPRSYKDAEHLNEMDDTIDYGMGNRQSKSRCFANMKFMPTYIPKCNLVTTAEEGFTGNESATARKLCLAITQDDLNLNGLENVKLRDIQNNRSHLNICMSRYICYVINHWDDLANNIKETYNASFEGADLGSGRLTETIRFLMLGLIIMCKWLISVNQLTESNAKTLLSEAKEIFIALNMEQSNIIQENNPTTLYLDAVKSMIDSEEIKIWDLSKGKAPSVSDIHMIGLQGNPYLGFKDENYYYFLPSPITVKVKDHYKKLDDRFPLGEKEILKRLRDEGIAENVQRRTFVEGKNLKVIQIDRKYIEDKEVNDGQRKE